MVQPVSPVLSVPCHLLLRMPFSIIGYCSPDLGLRVLSSLASFQPLSLTRFRVSPLVNRFVNLPGILSGKAKMPCCIGERFIRILCYLFECLHCAKTVPPFKPPLKSICLFDPKASPQSTDIRRLQIHDFCNFIVMEGFRFHLELYELVQIHPETIFHVSRHVVFNILRHRTSIKPPDRKAFLAC